MKLYQKVLLILALLAIVSILFIWIKLSDDYLVKHGVRVAVTISETGGKNVRLSYKFEAKFYSIVVGNTNRTLENGEVYYALINPQDPKDCLIDFSSPVFDRSKYVIIHDKEIDKMWLSNSIQIKYTFRRRQYKRFQSLAPTLDLEQAKGRAKLYVNITKPEVAYIVF